MNFYIQICSKINNEWVLQIKKRNDFSNKIYKTLIIACLSIFLQISVSSCKTCRCPAYSETVIQNSSNFSNRT
jgi:hypothetical protein